MHVSMYCTYVHTYYYHPLFAGADKLGAVCNVPIYQGKVSLPIFLGTYSMYLATNCLIHTSIYVHMLCPAMYLHRVRYCASPENYLPTMVMVTYGWQQSFYVSDINPGIVCNHSILFYKYRYSTCTYRHTPILLLFFPRT